MEILYEDKLIVTKGNTSSVFSKVNVDNIDYDNKVNMVYQGHGDKRFTRKIGGRNNPRNDVDNKIFTS